MTRLQQELSRKLPVVGCTAKYEESDGSLKIEYEGAEICTLTHGGQIRYKGSDKLTNEQNEVFEKIERLIDTAKEYITAYDAAPQFDIDGIRDYRKLSEWGGVVFGAKDMGDFGFQFSSWFKIYNGTGATMGDYSFDYEYAKKSFTIRSGLIEKQRLFTDEQFGNLYRCLAFTLNMNDYLTYEQETAIGDLMRQIEGIMPDVKNNSDYQFGQNEDTGITLV